MEDLVEVFIVETGGKDANSETPSSFDEKLIKEVEKYPVLYNSSLREHRDKQKRNLVWKSICQTLQNSRGPGDCEHRWRYLRDKYVKEKKKLTDPVFANERKEPWPYLKCAEFLDPFIKSKPCRKSIQRPASSRPIRRAAQLSSLKMLTNISLFDEEEGLITDAKSARDEPLLDGNLGEQPPLRKKTILGDNSKTLQALNRAAKRTASREEHFLLSLVNKFAALPDDLKDEFEMSTLSLLSKLKKRAAVKMKTTT